jgi:hypothetical protein
VQQDLAWRDLRDRCPRRTVPGRSPRRDLRRDRAHAARGQRRVALGEHAEDELEHAARRLKLPLEEDAAEERAEEPSMKSSEKPAARR